MVRTKPARSSRSSTRSSRASTTWTRSSNNSPRSTRAATSRTATRSTNSSKRRQPRKSHRSSSKKNISLAARVSAVVGKVFRWGVLLGLLGAVCWLVFIHVVLPDMYPLEKPYNLVVVSKDLERADAVVFIHISPETRKSIVAVLNGNDAVQVLGGYGEYSVRSLYALLQLEQKDDHFVTAAFSHALGVMVDEVIPVEGLTLEQVKNDTLATWFFPLITAADERLGFSQRLALYLAARSYRKNEVHPVHASEVAGQLGAHPLISELQARKCQVAVINTTGVTGLASGVGALLEQSGAFVVRLASESEVRDTTTVYAQSEDECREVLQRAAQLFPRVPELVIDSSLPMRYRAHMVIMAGNDLSETVPLE